SSVAKAFDEPDPPLALDEPDELDTALPPPPTVWPTVKLTAEIVPAAGAFRVVASRAFWALVTASWAEWTPAVAWATATLSTAGAGFSGVGAGFWAWVSFCWAAARLALAVSRATLAWAGSIVASTWLILT